MVKDDTTAQQLKRDKDKNVKKSGRQVGRNEGRKAGGWSADVTLQRRNRCVAQRRGFERKQDIWRSERKKYDLVMRHIPVSDTTQEKTKSGESVLKTEQFRNSAIKNRKATCNCRAGQ